MNYIYLLLGLYLLIAIFVTYALLCGDADCDPNSLPGKIHYFMSKGAWRGVKYVFHLLALVAHISFAHRFRYSEFADDSSHVCAASE